MLNTELKILRKFQKEILLAGGRMDEKSDLLAYYEGKSKLESPTSLGILALLILNNSRHRKGLFTMEKIIYDRVFSGELETGVSFSGWGLIFLTGRNANGFMLESHLMKKE